MESLAPAGIEWEIYGDRDIAIKTLPLRLESTDFLPLLEHWQTTQNSKVTELADFCLKLACVEAETSETLLSLNEIGEISRDLLLSADETTCPKGNPAPLHFNWAQIRKHFNPL